MKELKSKNRDIRPERQPLNQRLPLHSCEPLGGETTAIQALQPQMGQEDLPQQINMGWQRLVAQAERINQLSAELEQAMFELKAIANDINRDQRTIRVTQKPTKSPCEYVTAIVPCVRRKKAGAFVLTTRPVDLFRAEREATQVAQTLRHRAKRRRVVSPLMRKKKHQVQRK